LKPVFNQEFVTR